MCFMLYLEVWVLLSSRFLKFWLWIFFQVRFCLSLFFLFCFFLSFLFLWSLLCTVSLFLPIYRTSKTCKKLLIFRQLPLVTFYVGSSLNDLTVCKQRFPSSCWLPLFYFPLDLTSTSFIPLDLWSLVT